MGAPFNETELAASDSDAAALVELIPERFG